MNRVVDPFWIRNPSDRLAIEQGCYFDGEAGQIVCDFIEAFCCQSKGKWAGQPIRLLDWQRDFLMRLFGWKRADGTRRFRRAYVEIAKKNGKSTLVSAMVLALLLIDGEASPEIYLNACDRSQASIVYDEARRMVEASPELSARLQPKRSAKRILDEANHGAIITNSAEAPTKDGLNPSGIIFDELHRQPDTELWDVFEHADSAREQPLWVSITTAGDDESGPWFEQRDYSDRVNRGEIPDISHLGIIYRAQPDDDIDDPETWRAANPSLGVTISEENFRQKLAEAKETPRKLAVFKRLRLNIVSKADTLFLDPAAWAACASPRIDPDALAGRPCFLGGDLSKTSDLTALAAVWPDRDGFHDAHVWLWMPEENLKDLALADKVPYHLWVDQGWIELTPGPVVDYAWIRKRINALAGRSRAGNESEYRDASLPRHDIRKILFDPYNATQLATELAETDGLPVAFLRQGFLSLSDPTKQLERLVKSRKIRHGNNPVLNWMIGNAVGVQDDAGNVKLSKRKSRKKIDGVAALVNAIAAATAGSPDGGLSVYELRGILTL